MCFLCGDCWNSDIVEEDEEGFNDLWDRWLDFDWDDDDYSREAQCWIECAQCDESNDLMNGLQINWDTDMGLYTDIHMLQ